jgi:hypothetical protein
VSTILADPVREDDLFEARTRVRDLVTTDLAGSER